MFLCYRQKITYDTWGWKQLQDNKYSEKSKLFVTENIVIYIFNVNCLEGITDLSKTLLNKIHLDTRYRKNKRENLFYIHSQRELPNTAMEGSI